jgi:CHAT domain-containing protein
MVNSRATAALMQEFYAQLFAGKGVSLALRDASRNLRSREGFAHPFYWAGFTVFGKN